MSEPEVFDVLSPTAEGHLPYHVQASTDFVEPPQKKPYDVTYKVRTMQEIMDMQDKEIKKVQGLLEVPPSTAAILLRHYNWNAEKLSEQFWNDPAQAFAQAGLSPPTSPSTRTAPLPPMSPRRPTRAIRPSIASSSTRTRSSAVDAGPFECPVCCVEYSKGQVATQTLALGCGHRFCRGCWTEYLSGKVKTEGESANIQCMESGCDRIIRPEILDELVTADVSKKWVSSCCFCEC